MQSGITPVTPAEHSKRHTWVPVFTAWVPVPFAQMGRLISNVGFAAMPYLDPCTCSVPFSAQD